MKKEVGLTTLLSPDSEEVIKSRIKVLNRDIRLLTSLYISAKGKSIRRRTTLNVIDKTL